MKKVRWTQRIRKALWWTACALSAGIGYQTQVAANCADPDCNNAVTYTCSSPCTTRTGNPYACCCGTPIHNCCQYTCQTVYCDGPSSCSGSANSFWGGAHKYPYDCNQTPPYSGQCLIVVL
jgi:hypothetical protein